MLIQDRIKVIIKANNLTSAEFSDQIGIKRSNLSHVLNGRNKPGLEFLSKLITAFPKVNASWLLTGEQRVGEFQSELKPTANKPIKREQLESAVTAEVEKIVVFYKNGSFKEYSPNGE